DVKPIVGPGLQPVVLPTAGPLNPINDCQTCRQVIESGRANLLIRVTTPTSP
ncbi:MAG: hypothetical protein HC902_13390, partial [Calothrix sp. SM1_5_4]|nr:hypothetical protein [Calothrix sp. SM1_5_4]